MDQAHLRTQTFKSNVFRWTQADAYLFDIDGTLLITRDGVHRNALHLAMHEVYGVQTSIEGIAYHGKTDPGILRAALARVGVPSDVFEAKLPAALEVVCRDVAANAGRIVPRICEAIPAVLARLKALGKLLGVASGNLETPGWHKLEAAGLRDFFSFGCFSDRWENRADIFLEARNLARQRLGVSASICFIGDTPEDVKAAKQAGAHVIAVCTGIFKADELTCHEPDVCVASCAELLDDLGG